MVHNLIQPPVIKLTKPKKELSAPLRFITSPKLTAVLAGTLTALVTRSPKATAKAFFLGGGVAGLLKASPKARTFVKEKILAPEKTGEALAGFLEDPKTLLPKEKETFKEKVIDATKTAGLIGGGAAIVAGGVALGKKIKAAKIPKIPSLIGPSVAQVPSQVLPAAILPARPSITPLSQPLGAVQKPIESKVDVAPRVPSVVNTFNPQINIKISKSRRFINQQVLVKR